jgi:hypothetical protein
VNVRQRSTSTLTIEELLKHGESVSSIARTTGLTRQWVIHIKKRLLREGVLHVSVTPPVTPFAGSLVSDSHMKSLTLRLTSPVFDALAEACAIANRKDPEESITLEDYVGELVINRVVELGLLRKNKR